MLYCVVIIYLGAVQQCAHDAQQLRVSACELRGASGRVQAAARRHQLARAARVQRAPHLRVQVLPQRVHVVADAALEYERLLWDHADPGPDAM